MTAVRDDREGFIVEYIVDGNEEGECVYPPHMGHFSRLGGTWFCDTCNSPYCDRA
jgi:hypothetical protein